MEFTGMSALVTGASSGIGEVFARELYRRGAKLVLVARRQEKLEALASELRNEGQGSIEVVPADLSQPHASAQLVQELQNRGLQIDVLINNAGFGLFGRLSEADPERTSEQVQLNVAALTELSQALLPGMLQRDRGAIVNLASTAAFQPVPYMAVYSASKAYVLTFTEALWAETRGTGVRVTALCPGPTNTAFFDTASEDAAFGRRMEPEDVVEAAFKALERNKSTMVPGLLNHLLANSSRIGRRQSIVRIVELAMRPRTRNSS